MKYKLIAIDMDGTLLNSQKEVSDRNRKALVEALEKGIHIVITTGRILSSALYFNQALGLKGNPVIACNGALISCSKGENIIYESSMDLVAVKKAIQLAEENSIYYHFYEKDTFYSRKPDAKMFNYHEHNGEYWKNQNIKVELFENPMEILDHKKPNVYKVVFIEKDKDKLLEFRKKLETVEGIDISSSWDTNIEVMNEGVSKGRALEYLIGKLNLEPAEVVSIGDNENDISMLKVAGLAIGMKNGIEEIKNYADFITASNDEDGVAKAIEKYVLNHH